MICTFGFQTPACWRETCTRPKRKRHFAQLWWFYAFALKIYSPRNDRSSQSISQCRSCVTSRWSCTKTRILFSLFCARKDRLICSFSEQTIAGVTNTARTHQEIHLTISADMEWRRLHIASHHFSVYAIWLQCGFHVYMYIVSVPMCSQELNFYFRFYPPPPKKKA